MSDDPGASKKSRTGLGVGLAFVIGVLTFFITMQVLKKWGVGGGGEPLAPVARRAVTGLQMAQLPLVEGDPERTWSLKEQEGKVVVVNMFATWCGPCQAELPELKALARKYQALGVVFAAISLDQDGQRKGLPREMVLREFIKQESLPFPVLLPSKESMVWRSGGISIPQTFLYDRKGRVARQIMGSIVGQNMKASLDELLKEP